MLRSPVFRAALTSSVVLAAGDVLCQTVKRAKRSPRSLKQGASQRVSSTASDITDWAQDHDWRRTLRFAVVGLTLHGPWFFHSFRWIDSVCGPSTSLATALKKTVLGQVTVFPAYVALFFTYTRLLEGQSLEAGVRHLQAAFWPTYKTGWMFWPAANVINFTLVPASQRVLYVNAAGLLWNAYMSWQDSR